MTVFARVWHSCPHTAWVRSLGLACTADAVGAGHSVSTPLEDVVMQKSFSLRRMALAGSVGLAAVALLGCSTTGSTEGKGSAPSTRAELEAQSTAALQRLYTAMPGTRELVAKSTGTLICPAVIGGSFVIGAEYGKCVLRSNGSTRGFYQLTGASVGWQAGGQSKAVIYVFTTRDAYKSFVDSDGVSVGAGVNVAVGRAGVNGTVDTATAMAPVSAYVLNNAGLEAGASLQGTKITKISM